MKMLLCQHCHDGVVLAFGPMRSCLCGSAAGHYTDQRAVEITNGHVVALDNTYVVALLEDTLPQGSDIPAFNVARPSPNITVVPRVQTPPEGTPR